MNARFSVILVLLVCWAFASALCATQLPSPPASPVWSDSASIPATPSGSNNATASVTALPSLSGSNNGTASPSVTAPKSVSANATVTASPIPSESSNATVSAPISDTAAATAPISASAPISDTAAATAPISASAPISVTDTDTAAATLSGSVAASVPATLTGSGSGSLAASVPASILPGSVSASAPVSAACDDNFDCVSEGDTCYGSWTLNTANCTANNGADCCAYGLGCFNGECAVSNIGATCSAASPCVSFAGEALGCSSGTCKYLSYAGDSCEDDDDTYCAAGLTCTDDVCTGQAANQTCDVATPCNNGLFCQFSTVTGTATCQNLLGEGETCHIGQCAAGFFCFSNATATVCTATHTVDEGAACTQTIQCEDEYQCIAGVCTEPAEEYTSCKADSDCSAGESCVCSYFTGDSFCDHTQSTVNPCAEDNADALDCAAENNCHGISVNENSCFYKNCYSEFKDIQSCGCDNTDSLYSSCYYNDYCGGFPGWAIALIVIGAIALILAVVAVVYVAMKPKNNYESI